MTETWTEVVGFEGVYEVSSRGRVRSLDKRVRCGYGKTRVYPGRILRPALTQGYPTVGLWHEGKQTMARVHRLVCEAFHGPAPSDAHEVAHRDGNRGNANADNVRWATHTENEADKIAHGTLIHGEKHHYSKLTALQVREIRASPESYSTVAHQFGVSPATVCLIKGGKTWRHAA